MLSTLLTANLIRSGPTILTAIKPHGLQMPVFGTFAPLATERYRPYLRRLATRVDEIALPEPDFIVSNSIIAKRVNWKKEGF